MAEMSGFGLGISNGYFGLDLEVCNVRWRLFLVVTIAPLG